MSQVGQVIVNYNIPQSKTETTDLPVKTLLIGLSQRGPVYRPVSISDVESFLIVFGQPTNKYEFDFFEAVKSVVESGGIAVCYRVPYADQDKKLYDTPFEYYIVDLSKIRKLSRIILEDQKYNGTYYKFYTKRNARDVLSLYIEKTDNIEAKHYVILQNTSNDSEYYKLYIYAKRVYITPYHLKPGEKYDVCIRISLQNNPNELDYMIYVKNHNGHAGIYLSEYSSSGGTEPIDIEYKNVYDVVYKLYDNKTINLDEGFGAKLTFTLLNDFNSAFVYKLDDINPEISLRSDCFNIKTDIDPSQIFGIFPILFGPKDAELLRNIETNKLCYLDEHVSNQFYMDRFEVYPFKKNTRPFQIKDIPGKIIEKFDQFERSPHFNQNWFKNEVTKLIDQYIPQETSECKNTLGIAFVALYLDDEHKLDYKVLESFYGCVGTSTKIYDNIEDLVNKYSTFFHLSIDGCIEKDIYIRAFNRRAFIYSIDEYPQKWIVPFCAPYTPEKTQIVDTSDIFAYEPPDKFSQTLSKPLSRFYDILLNTEFLNNVPFNYVLSPGLTDVLLLSTMTNVSTTSKTDSIVPYVFDRFDLEDSHYINIADKTIGSGKQRNVRNLYKLISMYTAFGDKGTIAFIDIPEAYNMFLKENIAKCYGNENKIKDLLSVISQPVSNISFRETDIFPQLNGSREIYDRTYPLFNYQWIDKDKRLTRYHRFNKPRRYELVPGSVEVIAAYINHESKMNFSPIAGTQSIEFLENCHKSLIENNVKLYKLLFDLYSVSSLMNDRNNGTYPIQQTTWKNSTSVLKQLHAFRIYVAIRRYAYDICKSYLYEPNIENNRNNLQNSLNYMLSQFKQNAYIDSASYATVWADTYDIEQNQVQVQIIIGIYGAIVKIIINLNLTDMKIDYVN